MDHPGKEIRGIHATNNSSVSKWQLIPADLLYVIVNLCFGDEDDGDDGDPRVLMQIILAHPTIHANKRRVSGSEICHTPAELRKALERTNGGTIKLQCWFDSNQWDRADGHDRAEELLEVIQMSRLFLRIRHITFLSGSSKRMEGIGFDGWDLPVLEEAVLEGSPSVLDKQIQQTAHRLRFLSIIKTGNDPLNWDLSKMSAPLAVELVGNTPGGRQRLQLRQMITSTRNIVELTIWDFTIPGSELLSLPMLQTMELNTTRFECNLDCPSLTKLHLYQSSIRTSGSDPFVSPSLKALELNDLENKDLLNIRVGSLETLQFLFFTSGDVSYIEMFFAQMIKPGHVRPRTLQLQHVHVDSSSLISILREVPDLSELLIEKCPLEIQLFEAFAGCSLPAELDSPRRPPIVPSLQVFKVVSSYSNYSKDYADIIDWLTWTVDARSKNGYSLKAAIRDVDGTLWVDI
ncbi:hypothetical protein FRC17_011201 [Serendipita sp. 399]|nr:hypothetical protein FRC17_011201 [Serendipita sp. 399]